MKPKETKETQAERKERIKQELTGNVRTKSWGGKKSPREDRKQIKQELKDFNG